MKRTAFDCDGCKAKDIPQVGTIGFHVGWDIDPAGGSSTRDIESFELCPDCIEWLRDLIGEQPQTIYSSARHYSASIPTVICTHLDFNGAAIVVETIKHRIRERNKPARHPDLKPGG